MQKSITSIGSYLDQIVELNSNNQIAWYRGHFNSNWFLQPKIWRDNQSHEFERNFTNRFSSRAASRAIKTPHYDDVGSWLSIMQHHQLPTRLLDWSRSPLIALYFAIEKYIFNPDLKPIDACIWVLYPHLLNYSEINEKITPSIDAHMSKKFIEPAFTGKFEEPEKVLAVMSSENDIRMFVQQGCFTIHSYKGELDKKYDSKIIQKIIIKKQYIKKIAKQLDACGFRSGDIYPDLDNLSKELVNTFKGNL